MFGALNAFVEYIADGAFAGGAFELSAKVGGAEAGASSDIFEPDLVAQILVEVLFGLPEAERS